MRDGLSSCARDPDAAWVCRGFGALALRADQDGGRLVPAGVEASGMVRAARETRTAMEIARKPM
jgi:hypothetical protein